MSRCFPFPPPGYAKLSASGDALIQSIKIDSDKEKIKRERKEQKRREKEERNKIKKEKKSEKEKSKSIQSTNGANKRKRDCDGFDKSVDKNWGHSDKVHLQKKIQFEAEQLERSSLTEEYGQPVLLESPSCSSDITQSKTKKVKIEQSPSGNCTTQGKIIRFKLKRRESENAVPTDNNIPSTSGRPVTPATNFSESPLLKDTSRGVPSASIPDEIARKSILRPEELLSFNAIPVSQAIDSLPTSSSELHKVQKPMSAYESLFDEWVPSQIHFNAIEGSADEQWLFSCKKQAPKDTSSFKAHDGKSGQHSNLLQPRAHLVPEVDLYAMPFTVPF